MTSDQNQPEATSQAPSRHGDQYLVDHASANPHQASWQASQVELLLQNVRSAGFSNVLAVGCLWWVAQPHMGLWAPALWCLPLPVISLMYMAHGYFWVRYRRAALGEPGFIRRLLVYPILQAVTWGWMCLGLYPNLDVEGQFLVTLTVAAVMPIGAVASSALREAGLAWVVTLTPFLFYTLLQGKYLYAVFIGPAVFVTALVSAVAVISISRDVRKRLIAETEAVEGREALSVLLRDIESQSDDWVWGIDAQRRLVHAAPALVDELTVAESDQILHRQFLDLLTLRMQDAPRAIEQLVALTRRFNEGKSFRNLEFSVAPRQSGEAARLWMISGVPLNQGEKGIGGWRGVIRDVTVLRRQEEELHRLAHIDALTGLTNRHFLVERCARVLEGLSENYFSGNRLPLSLYLLDLDDFKAVNDSFGHMTGDLLLQEVGHRLSSVMNGQSLMADAVLARLGGDEFAVLLTAPHTEVERDLIGQALCAVIRPTWVTDTLRIEISASVGVASCTETGTKMERLLREADVALYEAKAAGRDQVLVFTREMGERVAKRMVLSKELGQLLDHNGRHGLGPNEVGELILMYQPQVDLCSGRLVGVEALVRWNHPVRGLIPPIEFIPVAEETGMIVPLGRWVMQRACSDASAWPDHIRVAVNVSSHQVGKDQLIAMVRDSLHKTALPAERLELELTESALMSDPEEARATLIELRELGVTVALDDFGTGYSSLAYLARLPVDVLKIDRAFVSAMATDRTVEHIVVAVIQLSRALGLKTLAEGIETAEQLNLLKNCGCQLGQGYYFAKPMPVAQLAAWRSATAAKDQVAVHSIGRANGLPNLERLA